MSFSLEQQLSALARIGLALNPGITLDDLLLSASREEYESEPYVLLLYTFGGFVESGSYDRRVCDAIWHLDTECIEDHGDYARVVRELAQVAGVSERVSALEDHVDVLGRTAWVSYRLDGQPRRLDAVVQDDWLDPEVLAALMSDLAPPPRAFADLADGQAVLLVCLEPAQLHALNELLPQPFHVHTPRKTVSPWAWVRQWFSRGSA